MFCKFINSKGVLKLSILLLVLFTFTSTCFAVTQAGKTNSTDQPLDRSLSVTGSADVMVIPDEVVFTLAVETTNMDIVKAKSDNDASIKKINTITKELKIENKYVKTDYINVNPKYTYTNNGDNVFKGYVIHRSLVITLKDLTKFDVLFTRILAAGANYVQNVQFKTTELRKYKDQARSLAIQAAREKASALAKGVGQTIGKARTIQEIQEDSYSYYSPWSSWGYGGANSFSNVNAVSNATANAPGTGSQGSVENDFSPGQIKVSARVSVVFDLN